MAAIRTSAWKRWVLGAAVSVAFLSSALSQKLPLYLEWDNYTAANGMPGDKVLCVAVDGDRVWAGTENGLVLLEGGRIKRVFKPEDGLASRVVTGLAPDTKTGDLWIATLGGLSRYSGGEFQNFTSLRSGLANDVVFSVAVQGVHVWAATAAGLSRLDTQTGEWSIFNEKNTPMLEPWPSGIALGAGKVYFGVWGGGLLEYQVTSGRWKSYMDGGGAKGVDRGTQLPASVTGIAFNREANTFWVSTHFGLSSYDGRKRLDYRSGRAG